MHTATATSTKPVLDQRRSSRVIPTTGLRVEIPGLNADLQLQNLSYGGFAVSARRAFWRGMTHRFTFVSASGLSIELVAKAVHCYRLGNTTQERYVSGWEFMAGSADRTEAAIGRLLEAATERIEN
jgi:hypothetical protein